MERLAVISAHVFCNVLLFYAIARRRPRWLWIAVLFKTLLDTLGAFAQFWGVETLGKLWTIEAGIVLFGLVAWWGARRVREHYPPAAEWPVPQTQE